MSTSQPPSGDRDEGTAEAMRRFLASVDLDVIPPSHASCREAFDEAMAGWAKAVDLATEAARLMADRHLASQPVPAPEPLDVEDEA